MADTKVSALTALTGASVAADDKLYIVDTSATTSGSKSITIAEARIGLVPGTRLVTPSGDSTGATDVTNIQAAMDALTDGGTVYLAPGQYYTNATLYIPAGVGIEGIGNVASSVEEASSVLINHKPATDIALLRCSYTPAGGTKRHIGPIRGLRITNGGSCADAGVIFMESVYELRIDRCALMNFKLGLRIQDTICSVFDQVYIEGTYVAGGLCANLIAGPSSSTTVVFRDCRLRRSEYCVRVNASGCDSLVLDHCICEACIKGILRTSDGHNHVISAYTEAMNEDGLSSELVVADSGAEYTLTLLNSIGTKNQSAPSAIADGDTAITIAELKTGLLTMTSTTAPRAPTVPTGAAVEGTVANPGIAIGQAMDWAFLNLGTQTVTITASSGHTLVGAMAISAGSQGLFRTRCTATDTAITYRLA